MFDAEVTEDPLVQIRQALERLRTEDRSGWSTPALTDRAVQLAQVHGEVEAVAAGAAGQWADAGGWQADGSRNAVSSLRWHAGRSGATARRLVDVGRLARRHPATAKALDAGELSADHAARLARAVIDERRQLYERDEAMLLDHARRLEHRSFAKVVTAWELLADDALDRSAEAGNFEQRNLKVAALLDGLAALAGTLEPEGLAILRAAIDAYRTTDPDDMPGGPRTPTQATYDAFIAALAASINGAVPGRPRRTTDLIIDHDTLQGRPPTDLTLTRTEIVGVGPVAPSLLRRLAADSAIGRIVASAAGLPLDVGTQVRCFTRAHRRAIRFRDDTCVWPGCGLPGTWCDIDHAIQAAHGGATAVHLGRFLCHRHHHLRHRGWAVVHDPVRRHTTVTSPYGATYTSGPDPPAGGT